MHENLPISVNNSCFLPQKSRNLLDFGDFHNLPGKSVSVPGFSQNLPAFYPENTRHGPARLKKTMPLVMENLCRLSGSFLVRDFRTCDQSQKIEIAG